MKTRILIIVTTIFFVGQVNSAFCQHSTNRSDYVSDASYFVQIHKPKANDHSPETMAKLANKFLAELAPEQKKLALHKIDSLERKAWTNVPQRNNGGLSLGSCNEKQIRAFCDMLSSLMSEQGYSKICNIMLADDQLLSNGRPRRGFGTEDFFVVLFGKPSATGHWGFQLDGHHLGINLSISNGVVSMSPSFIGTQPDLFQIHDKKIRPLSKENDIAFSFVNSLSIQQKRTAVIDDRRGRMIIGPGNLTLPKLSGLSCSTLDKSQKKLLMSLIRRWVGDLPKKQAEIRMKEIESDLHKTHFSWNGALKNGSAISYRIQGPTLVIEYAAQDPKANHIHTMYLNPLNLYGKKSAKNDDQKSGKNSR